MATNRARGGSGLRCVEARAKQGSATVRLWQGRALGVRAVVARASSGDAGCVQVVAQAAAAGSGRRAVAVQGTGRDRGAGEAQGWLKRKSKR